MLNVPFGGRRGTNLLAKASSHGLPAASARPAIAQAAPRAAPAPTTARRDTVELRWLGDLTDDLHGRGQAGAGAKGAAARGAA